MTTPNKTAEEFWIVWNPSSSAPPSHRHQVAETAQMEALRLAKKHPGQKFIVLRAERQYEFDAVAITEFLPPLPF